MDIRNISVIGLGKLGFPLAVCLANKGYQVIAVDVDQDKIKAMGETRVPFYEPGLKEILEGAMDKLKVTDDYNIAVLNSEVTFIVVPTPSNKEGGFSTEYVLKAIRQIGPVLRNKTSYHLVVLTSTVIPGSIDGEIKPGLESYSKKTCGVDFGLCYNPEFIALGSVVYDLYHPDFVLIGESDAHSGEALASVYEKFCDNRPPIARMNFINAELTKLLLNTYLTMKISYANMVAQLCESLAGADVDVITRALGMDSRIGSRYLKGALAYGGPCFPRDNLALLYTARRAGIMAGLTEATHTFNVQQIDRLAEMVLSKLPPDGKVGILGLSYKPNTDVIEESPGILLARILIGKKVPAVLYDPAACENARRFLKDRTNFAATTQECIERTDVIVITTPWEEFKEIHPSYFQDSKRRRIIIDCWRILDPVKYKAIAEHIQPGVGPLKD